MDENDSKKRKRGGEIAFPRKQSRTEDSATDSMQTSDQESTSKTKHTKKERKSNRSTRIHSLRKLLARDTLPSTIRQDRERELNALLHEQSKHKTKKADRKVLEKYHYVRFVERSKAEKRLKQLRKQQQQEKDDDEDGDVDAQIHEMEVNRNYAIYAPLAQKYVSVFAGEGQVKKPDMWYRIEQAMTKGDGALMALREGTAQTVQTKLDAKDEVQIEASRKVSQKIEQLKQTNGKVKHVNEDDGLIDGGFFER